jgi:hypothetical protein
MVKGNKTVKKGRKRHQKGGDSLQPQPQPQSKGIWGSITDFWSGATSKGEEWLTQGQSKIQEGLSAVGEKVDEGKAQLGNAISGVQSSVDKININENQSAVVTGPATLNADEATLNADNATLNADEATLNAVQSEMEAEEKPAIMAESPSVSVGGRRKKSLKGGSDIASTASPVHGLKVAKPTYWIGGKKRSHKKRSHKKRCNSKKSRKSAHKKR